MSSTRSFASDNNAGVHPKVLESIARANAGHVRAYGHDPVTKRVELKFKEIFGSESETFFVFNGTGANVISLAALAQPFEAIVCTLYSHIQVDECGAPERFLGSKLIGIPAADGKLTPIQIEPHLKGAGDQHHVQPRAISITQSTELGTVYSIAELSDLCRFAKKNGLYVHMDGARLANAAASLNASLDEITTRVGIDILSFGGTKNGILMGEAVVVLNPKLVPPLRFIRKQAMQLSSKMRFISCQFEALFEDDLWIRNARHANQMARLLSQELEKIPNVRLFRKAEANGVFVYFPKAAISRLQQESFFYVLNESEGFCRLMTSFDTTEEDVLDFCENARKILTAPV